MENTLRKRNGNRSCRNCGRAKWPLGLIQESFASGKMLAKTKMDTGFNPLIKAVVDDFATSEGRTVTRDGLKENLSGKKPAEVKIACIEILGKVARSRRKSAWRCNCFQELVAPDQPKCCRSIHRGRISWYRRRCGKRCRESDVR
jgi:hypothetical protein